ncbi:uncharacterized protein N0V89_010277 [Didymosphaeria variabile]|uniref:Heterokaryon incompatibility domain-containing protein n=1 Tax=Didymosphaeria variabile TaxID=1932322 RepID=A0A9W8XBG7_9PLEO|nr:uncharacterized protein N0V89_010277 [Didymosphaeria variabile]KAJ4346348.1 hypothetical protein N0V89_010277 [Didymosphaeria variabile]
MHSIYTQASNVAIWLGDLGWPGKYIKSVFKFFKEFATGLTAEGIVPSYAHLVDAWPDDLYIENIEEVDVESLDGENAREIVGLTVGLRSFIRHCWFERTWTVQEFFLAQKSIFYCGGHTFDGGAFMQFMSHLTKHDRFCCAVDLPIKFQIYISNACSTMEAFQHLKTFRSSLLECIGSFRHRKATDPRDKIYGLLGLGASDTKDLIQPDYTLSVEQVYENFVVSLLDRTKHLDVFSHVRTERQPNFNLPSFVPDWTMDLSEIYWPEQRAWSKQWCLLDVYDACHGSKVDFKAQPGALSIRGKIIDVIRTVATQDLGGSQRQRGVSTSDAIDEWLKIANVPPQEEDPGLAKRESFWVAMCAGIERNSNASPEDFNDFNEMQPTQKYSDIFHRLSGIETDLHEGYEETLRKIPETKEAGAVVIPDPYRPINMSVGLAHRNRRVMGTRDGRVGLAPKHARQGDVVAVLTGGRVPFILRPEEHHYTIVGDAYVHGIMDGEALQAGEELEYIELH